MQRQPAVPSGLLAQWRTVFTAATLIQNFMSIAQPQSLRSATRGQSPGPSLGGSATAAAAQTEPEAPSLGGSSTAISDHSMGIVLPVTGAASRLGMSIFSTPSL